MSDSGQPDDPDFPDFHLPKIPRDPLLWALVMRWLAVVIVTGVALVERGWSWALLVVAAAFIVESVWTEIETRRDRES